MRRLVLSLFGVGLIPGPSGTYASLVTAAGLLAIHGSTMGPSSIGVIAAVVLGSLATILLAGGVAEPASDGTHKGSADPHWVVTDEVAGQALAIAIAGLSSRGSGWLAAGLAFLAFRVFDIAKPGPIRAAERLPGGVGILADDLVAGAIGGALVLGVRALGLL